MSVEIIEWVDESHREERIQWSGRMQDAPTPLRSVFPRPSLPPIRPIHSNPHPLSPIPQHLTPDTQHRVDVLLAEAERRWGKGALVRWGDTMSAVAEVEAIPTGFSCLDDALGIGGIPCGRISELFGADTSGKHALVASIAAQCQKQQGVVVWIDPAERLDPEQMRALEVDAEAILVARPRSEMDALEMAVRLARSGGVRMIVLEMPSSPGIEASAGNVRWSYRTEEQPRPAKASIPGRGAPDKTSISGAWGRASERATSPIQLRMYARRPYGLPQSSVPNPQPSALGLALRRLVAAVHRNNIAFLFISGRSAISYQSSARGCKNSNHPPSPIPYPLTPNTQHPSQNSALRTQHSSRGGQALRYFASVRLQIERREWIRLGRDVVGCRSTVRVVKNKLAAPEREAEMDLRFVAYPMPVD